jgi:hypothetical protein
MKEIENRKRKRRKEGGKIEKGLGATLLAQYENDSRPSCNTEPVSFFSSLPH